MINKSSVVALATLLAILLISRMANVADGYIEIMGKRLPEACVWRSAGMECLGCGMTRGIVYLFNGEMALAWKLHPGSFVIALLLLLEIYPAYSQSRIKGRTRWLAAAMILVMGLFLRIL
jgi:hypothetical protein